MRTPRGEDSGTPCSLPNRPVRREENGHALVPLGEWPGVTAGWEVAAAGAGAVLRVELDFDPSSYLPRPSGRGRARWRSNAARDLGIVRRLGRQLGGAAEVGFSVETGLLAGAAAEADGGAVRDWVAAVEAFLRDGAAGRRPVPPPAPLRLEWVLDPAGVDLAPLFELAVDLVMRRARPPAPAGAAVPGTPERVAARIPPSLRAKAGDGAAALERFARDFESALCTASTQWKLASPTPADGRVDPGAAVSLWVLRVGSGPGDVRVSVPNPGAPRLYMPRPIAAAPVSCTGVNIRSYRSGEGFVEGGDLKLTFSAVDLDAWLRRVLEWVDTVLSPAFAPGMRVLSRDDGRDYLAELVEQRDALADWLEALLVPAFTDEPVDPDGPAERAARGAFREQLGASLASAYALAAAVQLRVEVSAPEAAPGLAVPRLRGVAVPRGDAPAGPAFTVSPVRLPPGGAGGEPAYLTFLVTAPGGATGWESASSGLSLALELRATQVEPASPPGARSPAERAPGPLSLLRPPASGEPSPLLADLGRFEVPLVLRAVPAPLTLTEQQGTPSFPGAVDDLAAATAWDYSFGYCVADCHPQDRTHVRMEFDAEDSAPEALAGQLPAPEFFGALAAFVAAGPAVRDDLESCLAPIDPETVDEKTRARAAVPLESFLALARDLVDGVRSTAPPGPGAPRRVVAPSGGAGSADFVVEETSRPLAPGVGAARALVVMVRGAALPGRTAGSEVAPEVRIPGWTARRVDGEGDAFAYVYVDPATRAYLGDAEGHRIPERTFVLPGLDALHRPCARATVWVVRNAELVAGRKTRDAFVYSTPEVRFADPVLPCLDHEAAIDIARIGGKRERRTLAGHLAALISSLFASASPATLEVQVECAFDAALREGDLHVRLPIHPRTAFATGHRVGGDAATRDDLPHVETLPRVLAKQVEAWLDAHHGERSDGSLVFDLTLVVPRAGRSTLLRLSSLTLALADVAREPRLR